MICRTYDAEGKCLTICHDLATALADNKRLRGLLREALEWMDGPFSDPALAAFFNRVDAALAGAADQPSSASGEGET